MASSLSAVLPTSVAEDWPQWRGPARDGVWRESGIIDVFPAATLEPVWRAEIGGGYSGPTVANGRVYVTDRLTKPKQVERVHCFDEQTGKRLWSHEYDCTYQGVGYDAGPRASVTVHDGRAYALGTMGHLNCFEADTGTVLWKKDLNETYKIRMPIWGIAGAPLIEGDLVIVHIGGSGDASIVGLNHLTGAEVWTALADNAPYSAPIVIEQGKRRVLVCYTGDNVVGLDPGTGRVYWSEPFPPKQMPIGIASPVVSGNKLFLTNFFDGSLLLELDQDQPRVRKVWHRAGPSEKETDALHSIIATPVIRGDHIYGVDSYGELRCLDLMTGDRVWEDLSAVPKARWAAIHFVEHEDRMWMFNEMGELIISKLSPTGFTELSRAQLIAPTRDQLPSRRGGVAWAHPAFANKRVFARNDKELLCVDLAAMPHPRP